MEAFTWEQVPLEQMNPLVSRRVMHGLQTTIAQVVLTKGAVVPNHSHPHEQTTMLRSGKIVFRIEGKKIELNAGSILNIAPHLPHSVEALEDSEAIDVFSPVRDDWQRGEDAYLREA